MDNLVVVRGYLRYIYWFSFHCPRVSAIPSGYFSRLAAMSSGCSWPHPICLPSLLVVVLVVIYCQFFPPAFGKSLGEIKMLPKHSSFSFIASLTDTPVFHKQVNWVSPPPLPPTILFQIWKWDVEFKCWNTLPCLVVNEVGRE